MIHILERNMSKRKRIPTDTQTELLTKSRRRCCICFGLNQDLTELSQIVICFHLDGKNDITYLNDLKDGFGDIVSRLKSYHFAAYVKADHSITVYKPVPAQYKTNKKFTKPPT